MQAEQEWIDRTRSKDASSGFNIYDAGSPRGARAKVWEGFIDPEGNEITITNLQAFCSEHGLDRASMIRLAQGRSKLKSYKGWTHRNSQRKREYVKTHIGFIDPSGRPVDPITNLAAFCRKHCLDTTHMVAVAHGRILSYKGWTHTNGRQRVPPKAYDGFINPEGQRTVITNLAAFCRGHGLHPVRMHQLKSGQRKSHHGWTWREPDEQSTESEAPPIAAITYQPPNT